MGIKQNVKDGTWVACFGKRHPITRQPISFRRKGIKTKAEAMRVERELVLLVEERIKSFQTPKWPALVAQYLQSCRERGLKQKTVDDVAYMLNHHTVKLWQDRFVDSITTAEIRLLIQNGCVHLSRKTQKSILSNVRGVFNEAVEHGILQRNPCPAMAFRIGDKIRGVLTEEHTRKLLSMAKELNAPFYLHWAMALYTGMRNGELYALKWDRVNFGNRTIKVDTAWNNKDGFKSTKSGDDRILEIAPNLVFILKELKLSNHHPEFVLPRLSTWDKGEQARELRKFLVGINLPPVRFHDLRATWATILLSKGVEPIKVMKMGGWMDLKTMMIYVRKAGVDIRGMTDCLDLHNPMQNTAKVINLSFGSDR